MMLSSLIISYCEDHVLSFCLSIQSECRVFIRALSSYQVLPPFSTGVLSEIFLTPLCHSFNSSGGSVLLISSSIFSSYQVLIQFFPFAVGVLSKLYHSFPFSILF